jgi:hypothetical protein
MGKVSSQALTILPATPQRTAESLRVAPTPIMAEEMAWVLETGIPMEAAIWITVAAAVSAAKPFIGRKLVIRTPTVWITLQPPIAVPALMDKAESIIIQMGIASQRPALPV